MKQFETPPLRLEIRGSKSPDWQFGESNHRKRNDKLSDNGIVEAAKEHFGVVVAEQLARVERLRQEGEWADYSTISPIVIGMIGGDGIGPTISAVAQSVLEHILRDEVGAGQGRVQGHRGPDDRETAPRR